ncbi:phage tail sheath family protein [Romeria aff. gracilis LEGE 07310]|uniref:Phage tail sheath family protein n=1 Tax=Vasconcelosia minhoensis LEGE 07310 TaxID=915328 RepID=A0A8J7DEJ8_9CYAN|nr:phage tail sheath C-terminal domain-containing protein [Romeria gracilis]MBE9079838.1 phage tail sheath family protein [Romeria aff. gracilis LEGE 07310]
MALDYFAPGVYVEEVDRGSRPIEGVSMSVAGFVGFTEDVRGDATLFEPMMVTNWAQYLEFFGRPGSDGFTDFGAYLPFAVQGWFMNGGGRCWVVSIGTQLPGSPQPSPSEHATKLITSSGKPSLSCYLKPSESEENGTLALPSGTGRLKVSVLDGEPKPLPDDAAEDAEPPLNNGEYFTVIVRNGDEILEQYDHLTMNPEADSAVADYAVATLEPSEYVVINDISQSGQALSRRPASGSYEIAPPPYVGDPDRLNRDLQGSRDDRTGIQGLYEIDEVSMVACPDLLLAYEKNLIDLDQVHGVMEMMLSMCENSFPGPAYRMAVIDPPPVKPSKGMEPVEPSRQRPADIAQWLTLFNRRSMFGATYYPWIKVANPRDGGRPKLVPPSGHMMGIWCRTDESRGVFKAPANETPRGVIGLAYETNMREQELLNPVGINCIRNFSSYNRGLKVWGARTLVEPDNVQWRYISVRRLLSYVEKSIEIGTQWVVFEPNDADLWARVNRTVSNFLERLWREGALFGSSPSEAFYVKCDGELNTHETIMLGRLYVEVGICPVRPAEFVIFRISQWAPNQ